MEKQYNNLYFDIESLPDLFSLCTYHETTDSMDMYYLLDSGRHSPFTVSEEDALTKAIYAANQTFHGPVRYHDLRRLQSNTRLASIFGCAPGIQTTRWNYPLIRDVDPAYNPALHPFIMGYNSQNYDLTMLGLYFSELICDGQDFLPPEPELLRAYNDELFTKQFKNSMPDRLRYRYVDPSEVFGRPEAIGRQPRYSARDVVQVGGRLMLNEGWNPSGYAFNIRKAMIDSGRHIDVARLNEKQSRVGLKRLLGMLGYQILEPEEDLSARKKNLNPRTFGSIADLFAYNASDTLNLKNLFHHKTYVAAFELKKQMLVDYPELIYDQKTETVTKMISATQDGKTVQIPTQVKEKIYAPGISPDNVRRNRHTINSSSAQLAATLLSPYSNMVDSPVVSFMYPSEKKAKETGIRRRNIITETEDFINTRLRPIANGPEGAEILEGLGKMIAMYRAIEGQDFNASHDGDNIADLRSFAEKINVPYMAPDGKASDCYITFSVGGLHGAQYNKPLFDRDMAAFNEEMALFDKVCQTYGSPLNLLVTTNDKGKPCRRKTFELDGKTYQVNDFLKSGSTLKKAEWKKKYTDPVRPELFPADSHGIRKLRKRYVLTSFGPVNHEDFTSYYPILLVNMSAFENIALGYDRYYEVYGNKEKFGKLMKDKSIDPDQREIYSNMRNGTKLVLNSASGAADTVYNTPIRMNNRITAMRIIGQLFTWRIGQAQSLEGASVVSTNTDGLYTKFDPELNAQILAREAAAIQVGIEPEPCFLVSKDANNRFEGEIVGRTGNAMEDVKITAASGGSLACRMGPNPEKALAHPAILDWALCEFLKYKALKGAMDDFEPAAGHYLLDEMARKYFPERRKRLQMFQNIVAASLSTAMYPFASHKPVTDENELSVRPIAMQHYSRVFYVDPDKVPDDHKKDIVYLALAYARVTKSTETTDASYLATVVIKDLNNDEDALNRGVPKLKKINGIELSTPCIICNEDLEYTTKIQPEWLDLDYYNRLLRDTYQKNWRNDPAGHDENDEDDDAEE